MPSKDFFKVSGLLLFTALAVSCGLVPNFSGGSISSAEKAQLYMQMGARYLEMDKLDVALEKLEAAKSLDSSNADIYNALGGFYEHIKEYDKAQDNYETAVRKGSENYNIKSNFGRFLCDRGDFKRGMALLQDAIDLPMNNRQWIAITNMGICMVKQNDLVRGEEYLRQALLLQDDYALALLEMQKISYEKREYLSARAFLERYLGGASHTPETLWIAFQTERAMGNEKLAEEYGTQLINTFPASKEAQQIKIALGK